MFEVGKFYKDKQGVIHEVLMIKDHRKFPVITIGKKGLMNKFTLNGQFYQKKTSNKDLTSEQVRSF